jgi:hypothetical protein
MRKIDFNSYLDKENTQKLGLYDQDIEALVKLVGHRCSVKTVSRLRSKLKYGLSSIKPCGIFSRLVREEGAGWTYYAGQSYPDEIRTLRQCILK